MLIYVSEKGRNPTPCVGVVLLLYRKKEGMNGGAVMVSEVL
jgi:hypothetical protein